MRPVIFYGKAGILATVSTVWLVAAAILISHFRFYYGVEWDDATKWGFGDGFLWGALLCSSILGRQRFLIYFKSWREDIFFLGLAVFCGVILHPTISTLLFWAIDGSISRPFVEDVLHLTMKRFPQGILAGCMIGFAGISVSRVNSVRKQSASSLANKSDNQTSTAVWLALKNAKGVRRVNITDIRYVEAAGNYVALLTGGAEHLERTTLKAMEKQLQGRRFRRISRKHLVNLDYIHSIESTKPKGAIAILENGDVLPISRQYKMQLQEEFAMLPRVGEAEMD